MAERILVVDDDPDALAVIRLMLQRRGYDVITAPGGAEALEILAGDLPELVLLDLMMPFMDGFEVCSRLKSDARTVSLPIIMLTAKAQMSAHAQGLSLGVDGYVTKPVHPDELVSHIRTVLDRVAKTRAYQDPKGVVIGCLGVKGGLGVTTTAVNIALALAARGRVALVDFSGDAVLCLGQSPFDWPPVLSRLEMEQIDRRAIERSWKMYSDTLALLYDAELLTNQARTEAVLDRLPDMVDFSVLDLGPWAPTTPASKQWILERCKAIALIVAPGRTEVERAQRILKQLGDWNISAAIHPIWVARWESNSLSEAAELGNSLGCRTPHVIPYSTEMLIVSQPDTPAASVVRELADMCAGIKKPLPD